MDPLVKFLEEDEDETLHSGADVDAFTAELNRDIEGTNCTTQQSSETDSASLFKGSDQITGHTLQHWQTSSDVGIVNSGSHQNVMDNENNQPPPQIELQKGLPDSENREKDSSSLPPDQSIHTGPQLLGEQKNFMVPQPIDGIQTGKQLAYMPEPNSEPNIEKESQMQTLQNPLSVSVGTNDLSTGQGSQQNLSMGFSDEQAMPMLNRQAAGAVMNNESAMSSSNQQSAATLRMHKQVPFGMLLPIIQPQLDKDRAMQLTTLYIKLKKNEISKDGFVRSMRGIVGDQMLKMSVYKLKTQTERDFQTSSSQFQSPLQASSQQTQIPSTQVPTDDGHSQLDSKIVQGSQMSSSNPVAFGQDRRHPVLPAQVINKQQQAHFPHNSLRTLSYDSQIRPTSHPSMVANSLGPTIQDMNMMNMPTFDWALSDSKKPQGVNLTQTNSSIPVQQIQNHRPSSLSHVKKEPFDQSNETFDTQSSRVAMIPPTSLMPTTSSSPSLPIQVDNSIPFNSRMSSISSPLGSGNSSKLTPKKPVVGQKKPIETPVSSPPSSKKQKVSGGSLDQSIEHLNDVTAVSGVNLREEEEQLFSGSKEDGRISEASRRVVQEEEERLILQKIPLQKKLVEILAKCGLKGVASDVERCLSFCVEERLRSLISNTIRLSKQRVDAENSRHKTIITSDVRQQIQAINRKAREELEKKQAETDKSQNPNDLDSASGIDGDKDSDENRARAAKASKEEDDKMRATAANVAVRAATGGGDMMSRWQLMIEAKQKQGGSETASASQTSKDPSLNASSGSAKNTESDKRDNSASVMNTGSASIRKVGRNQVVVPRVSRSISVKDLIAVLERETQMSKSALLYRLCNMISVDDASVE